ncbi:hypothetical protein BD410DRAFT_783815 [Rickenella mellea]|uniref:Yeast cell wall synthesis Kre9/Knh1-like N-terminal domain-containing protein n=1 Tax=Rickenella mellea TaxID=50990 RepID=A0A4Y7QHX2_9AGAM|nr:hypothetical protein BD410DRAFT_783815 [Rickenella mellea]
MFASFVVATLLAALPALADPTPNGPGPGDVFKEGADCPISWSADTTGVWKTMNIELMTGDNFNMVHLSTVASLDGTDTTKTTFTYPCLQVDPNSAIYFYQFSSPASPNRTWTTRFAIADASGNTVPPENQVQPTGGAAIPWGTGHLVDPSKGTPPPPNGGGAAGAGGNGTTTGSASAGSSSSSVPPTSLPTVANTTPTSASSKTTGSSTSSSSSSSGTPSGTAANSSNSSSAASPLSAYPSYAFIGAAFTFIGML